MKVLLETMMQQRVGSRNRVVQVDDKLCAASAGQRWGKTSKLQRLLPSVHVFHSSPASCLRTNLPPTQNPLESFLHHGGYLGYPRCMAPYSELGAPPPPKKGTTIADKLGCLSWLLTPGIGAEPSPQKLQIDCQEVGE